MRERHELLAGRRAVHGAAGDVPGGTDLRVAEATVIARGDRQDPTAEVAVEKTPTWPTSRGSAISAWSTAERAPGA